MVEYREAMMSLFNNDNEDADVLFLVNGTQIKGHKCVLAARCDGFKGMFRSIFQNVDGRYLIKDPKIDASIFREFLKFLYVDSCEITNGNVFGLYRLADMFFMKSLKKECNNYIRYKILDIDDVMALYQSAKLFEDVYPKLLRILLWRVAIQDFSTFPISLDIVEAIAKQCKRCVMFTEDDLVQKIFGWTCTEIARRNLPADKEHFKNLLAPILKFVDFQSLSCYVWTEIVYPNELASVEECLKRFYLHNVSPKWKQMFIDYLHQEIFMNFERSVALFGFVLGYANYPPEVIRFIAVNISILEFSKYEFTTEILTDIVRICPRTCFMSEDDLFLKVVRWSHVEIVRRNLPANRRSIAQILDPFVKYWKLNDMSPALINSVFIPIISL